MTTQHIALVTLVVDDYDKAIAFYCNDLGFDLIEDTPQADKRWVVVAPPQPSSGQPATKLLLAQATDAQQAQRIGDQTGGRVGFFLYTDNFDRDYQRYRNAGVRFLEQPRHEPYGTVAVFSDLYGNQWDLLQPAD